MCKENKGQGTTIKLWFAIKRIFTSRNDIQSQFKLQRVRSVTTFAIIIPYHA